MSGHELERWSVVRAVEVLHEVGPHGPAPHLLGCDESGSIARCEAWLDAVCAQAGAGFAIIDGESGQGEAMLGPDDAGARAWARAETQAKAEGTRRIVRVGAVQWECVMGAEDALALHQLRSRLEGARRVHVVATRANWAARERDAETRVEIVMERCVIRPAPGAGD